MVMHAVEIFVGDNGVKPITTAFVHIDVGSCQQLVGWFDRLDSKWNVTQCVQDNVKLVCYYDQQYSLNFAAFAWYY